MFLKRPGGQSQFSRHLAAQQRDDVFGTLELWMLEHLDAELSVETLARRASMIRGTSRACSSSGSARRRRPTCAAFAWRRLARQIENGSARVKHVARSSGFTDDQHMRRAYKRLLGVTPAEYRSRFQ